VEEKIHTGGRIFKLMSSVFLTTLKLNYLNAHQTANLGGLGKVDPRVKTRMYLV
jgi:hypothetical protein